MGHNALLEAVKRGHDALIRLLVENGAKCAYEITLKTPAPASADASQRTLF